MIKSDKDIVSSIGANIKSCAANAELPNIVTASDTDVSVHKECVNSYVKSQRVLANLRSIMNRDADDIVCAAEKFSDVDTKLASMLNQTPTGTQNWSAGGTSIVDVSAD